MGASHITTVLVGLDCRSNISFCTPYPVTAPPLPLFAVCSLGEHSSIPIGSLLPGLVLLYSMQHSWPPPFSTPPLVWALHNPHPRSAAWLWRTSFSFHTASTSSVYTSIPHSTPHMALLFASQHFPPDTSLLLIVAPLFHLNISYCVSNHHLDSPLANTSLKDF